MSELFYCQYCGQMFYGRYPLEQHEETCLKKDTFDFSLAGKYLGFQTGNVEILEFKMPLTDEQKVICEQYKIPTSIYVPKEKGMKPDLAMLKNERGFPIP